MPAPSPRAHHSLLWKPLPEHRQANRTGGTDAAFLGWSSPLTGAGVPDADSPDEAVFLPGRNVLLLAKPLLWCHRHDVPALALAPLEANPFPDATPEFFAAFQDAVNRAVGGNVRVCWPYSGL